MYTIENYDGVGRYGGLYGELRGFLRLAADTGICEHFHHGRFDWMMSHPFLDTDRLSRIAVFRGADSRIVGAALFDTSFDDRWYIIHSTSDESLLRCMLGYLLRTDTGSAAITVKANPSDVSLCALLDGMGSVMPDTEKVLGLDLSRDLSYSVPDGCRMSAPDEEIDTRQWRTVIHRGFGSDGEPEEPSGDYAETGKHLLVPEYIKTFAIHNGVYAAHCGVWYDGGDTAYIEPVATLPDHRRKGLARAAVLEALTRARSRGAGRAIVLSDQEFYFRIGMTISSEVGTWSLSG